MNIYTRRERLAKAAAKVCRRLLPLFGLALKKDLDFSERMQASEAHIGTLIANGSLAKGKRIELLNKRCALLSDGIKQANDAVIVERRKVNALRAERNKYRDGLWKIVNEGTYQGMYPGEKILVNIAQEALEARK